MNTDSPTNIQDLRELPKTKDELESGYKTMLVKFMTI